MLIERMDRQAPDYIEPTVIVQRDDFQRPGPARPRAAARARPRSRERLAADGPDQPKNRTGSASRSGRQSGSMLQGWPDSRRVPAGSRRGPRGSQARASGRR